MNVSHLGGLIIAESIVTLVALETGPDEGQHQPLIPHSREKIQKAK